MSADRGALLKDLQRRVTLLEDDIRERLGSVDGADERAWLESEYQRAVTANRTSGTWTEYQDDQITQAAVAWVLATVFVRFCEDNRLVPDPWIAGPGDRTRLAAERQQQFLLASPLENDRSWLKEAFDHLAGYPALAAVLDPQHNPLHPVSVSADAAEALLGFWRAIDDRGDLVHDLTDPDLSTRFLGDLYQDLSASARTRFALLQTPEFVEEFILDQTMEPALAERPLEGFRIIDPTCGSGHFLLGAFHRMFDRWSRQSPGLDLRERVQNALDAVHGVDLNPFAVAIARFRLTVAALKVSQLTRLSEAPAYRFHLAVGDSLLHGTGQQTLAEDTDLGDFTYTTEDLGLLQSILTDGRYDAVVGNPPYITVKDKALNQAYRDRYPTCKGTYALTVPFMERFFRLAKTERDDQRVGWVGQITSNSFMKREFGSKLIEEFLVKQDLRLVADTSGAYIPGHGTPTVIVVGRRTRPMEPNVHAVLGIRGEPGRPADPQLGLVWSSIVRHIHEEAYADQWVTIGPLRRDLISTHPWSLAGGGAPELASRIEASSDRLGEHVKLIGRTCHTGSDDAYFAPPHTWGRKGVPTRSSVPLATGDGVRDWSLALRTEALFPYDAHLAASLEVDAVSKLLWVQREGLRRRREPGGTHEEIGLTWYEWSRWHPERFSVPLGISFAFVATHNHFVLDRGGTVFKQSAPVIKLPAGAREEDHLELLGVLNSSVACFWLKQNSHNKGNGGIGGGIGDEDWEPRYEFTGTTLQDFPLPPVLPLARARTLDQLAQNLTAHSAAAVTEAMTPTAAALTHARTSSEGLRRTMIAQQEELDWEVYGLYGLPGGDLVHQGDDLPEVNLGERAFEIALARRVAAGEEDTAWFERHGSTPVTEIPAHWPEAYRELVQRRLDLIESDPGIRLLESPEHKRRWASEPWEKQQERALRDWLLTRLEDPALWRDGAGRPQVQAVAQLAEKVGTDAELLGVLELWSGRPGAEVAVLLSSLLSDEHVPFLAALRHKPSGLRKRAQWEQTWELQRAEDRGEQVGPIPVPQKYTTADFVKTSYWKHRGKLDVPKERFISYPGAERGADTTLVLGWAGWDHSQQAQALAGLTIARAQREGWQADQLTPLLAGLAELEPWLHQWHAEVDARMGVSPAQAMTGTLERELARLGLTRGDLAAWAPPAPTRGRRRTTKEVSS